MSATEQSTEQREIVATIREFVEREVVPVASELEHAADVRGLLAASGVAA